MVWITTDQCARFLCLSDGIDHRQAGWIICVIRDCAAISCGTCSCNKQISTPGLRYEALRWQTRCLCKAADVPYRGEHVFRHTFATNCYHKGIDVKILSRLLGHADVNITYNIYVHLYGDGFDEMYEALVRK